MPSQVAERCDLAIWEMEPGLLGAFSDRLNGTRTVRGPLVDTVLGSLHDRRLLVVSLKTHKLSEALQAVASAHGPRQTLLVGPASAVAEDLAAGTLIYATQIERNPHEVIPLPTALGTDQKRCGVCGDGPVLSSDPADVLATSGWAYDAARAAERGGVEVSIALAIVMPKATGLQGDETVQPPRIKQSFAHRAGGVIGSLWRQPKSIGKLWRKQSDQWEQGEQFACDLEELVEQIP